jgi:hypothetical protein
MGCKYFHAFPTITEFVKAATACRKQCLLVPPNQESMVSRKEFWALSAIAIVVAGCGGGGSAGGEFTSVSSTTTTTAATTGGAQGVYEGTASNGRYFNTIVLDNDQYYTLYGALSGGVFGVMGLITGTGQSGNGNFTSADLKDFPAGGIPISGTLSATYTPGVSFNAVVSKSGTAATYPGTPPDNTSYVYNTPASLASIVGAWNMTALTGAPVTLNIAANGTYAATSLGCNFSGSITPRASGKNVFDFTVTFGPAPCVLANQSGTGHAVTYILGNGQRQLIAAATDASRSNATVVLGAR